MATATKSKKSNTTKSSGVNASTSKSSRSKSSSKSSGVNASTAKSNATTRNDDATVGVKPKTNSGTKNNQAGDYLGRYGLKEQVDKLNKLFKGDWDKNVHGGNFADLDEARRIISSLDRSIAKLVQEEKVNAQDRAALAYNAEKLQQASK
jgi:hypothetical protein